ncbi:MAG: hypothetical protein DDT25_01113 [Chloroflexi bacterium]|nr:hypothetical protein [Chloroflexota bacterium]
MLTPQAISLAISLPKVGDFLSSSDGVGEEPFKVPEVTVYIVGVMVSHPGDLAGSGEIASSTGEHFHMPSLLNRSRNPVALISRSSR